MNSKFFYSICVICEICGFISVFQFRQVFLDGGKLVGQFP